MDIINYDTLEERMNSENSWTKTNSYFQLLICDRERDCKQHSLNEEINTHLKKIKHVNPDQRIDWEKEQEINENTFKEFGYSKLSFSLAYSKELMPFDKAITYLNEFIDCFEYEKNFFTNYDDLNEIINDYDTIKNYQSKGNYSYGYTDISENVFSCALIIVGENKIGAIVMRDND